MNLEAGVVPMIPRACLKSGFASDLETDWAEARREEGAYSRESVTDEQRCISPNRPKVDANAFFRQALKNVLRIIS
jgi:hypothetical protein